MNPFSIAIAVIAVAFVISMLIYFIVKKKGRHLSKKKTMDIILILVGTFLLIFTITMIVIFLVCGTVPDTLITCVFGACAGECGIMGWIKTTKDKHEARKWELEDRKYIDRKEESYGQR